MRAQREAMLFSGRAAYEFIKKKKEEEEEEDEEKARGVMLNKYSIYSYTFV